MRKDFRNWRERLAHLKTPADVYQYFQERGNCLKLRGKNGEKVFITCYMELPRADAKRERTAPEFGTIGDD